MEHLDEKQQFSVYLVLMYPNCSSTKMACYVFLKCVLNHPMMKENHGCEKKKGGNKACCRGRMSSAGLIFMKNSVCERNSHGCLFFMDPCLVR